MLLKRILTTLGLCLIFSVVVSAQQVVGDLTVRSNPPGASVTVTGDATVSGVTPTTFQQRLVGNYSVTVRKYGYENYHSRLTLEPGKPISLDIKLTPMTRLKAAARSMFIPGWGQRYTEQKAKGFVHSMLAVGSVVAFLLANDEFNYRNDLLKEQQRRYDSCLANGASYQYTLSNYDELVKRQKKAYDRENLRRGTIAAGIGIWSLSFLDALLFFPSDHATVTVGGLSLEPVRQPGSLGLVLTRRF